MPVSQHLQAIATLYYEPWKPWKNAHFPSVSSPHVAPSPFVNVYTLLLCSFCDNYNINIGWSVLMTLDTQQCIIILKRGGSESHDILVQLSKLSLQNSSGVKGTQRSKNAWERERELNWCVTFPDSDFLTLIFWLYLPSSFFSHNLLSLSLIYIPFWI